MKHDLDFGVDSNIYWARMLKAYALFMGQSGTVKQLEKLAKRYPLHTLPILERTLAYHGIYILKARD
jgi:hypothetical protein